MSRDVPVVRRGFYRPHCVAHALITLAHEFAFHTHW